MTPALVTAALCALPAPGPLDPDAARTFLSVAEEELAAGEQETALGAVREALRNDPTLAGAIALFRSLCEGADPLERASRLLDDGEPRAALAWLEGADAAGREAETSLLSGIAAYELDDLPAARAWLERAAVEPDLAPSAHVYLGLIAWRSGDRDAARVRLSTVAGGADPRLRLTTSDLLRSTMRQGRLSLGASVDLRYDSNIALLPDGTPAGTARGDGSSMLSASALAGPDASGRGFSASARGWQRWQFARTAYDFGGLSAGLSFDGAAPWGRWSAEAGWEASTLGGEAYLLAPRAGLTARGFAGPWAWRGSYRLRRETFPSDAYAAYSGTRHTGVADVFRQGGRWSVDGALRAERDATGMKRWDYAEAGPTLSGVWRFDADLRAGAFASLSGRRYVGRSRNEARTDLVSQGEIWVERDVGLRWSLRAAAGMTHLGSTDDAAVYENLYATVGASWAQGFW